ncbi:MAG: NAD(P)/FAD-dependent oxidoreductase [Saprospiraceae bacterium]
MKIAIIGGGAAGFFAAIAAAAHPGVQVVMLERGKSVLEKVRVSGGGRCNVTHACFEARDLIQHYPRGSRELLGPFLQFGPQDTVEWFARRGVRLKTEDDGRMFPVTDDSQTIVSCLWDAAKKAGVQIRTGARVENLEPRHGGWLLHLAGRETLLADRVLVASGSSPAVWDMLAGLGLQIVSPVPSLFTFNIKDPRLRELAGISVPEATLTIPGSKLTSQGPLLITHWGLSGPAILRLSAWGARELFRLDYRFPLVVNWLGEKPASAALAALLELKQELARKQLSSQAQFDLPARLWSRLLAAAGLPDGLRWADAGKLQLQKLAAELAAGQFAVHGKSTFKEEFVTAGGVALAELNFKTFESKRFPGLFFAGEVLDIDAITGGFNFQAAWTGGWIAGSHMAGPLVMMNDE